MKIAICKGFTNISFSNKNKSAASADVQYLVDQLGNSVTIDIVTGITSNTEIPVNLGLVSINDVDFDRYDLVLLFNFSINFFGGVENKEGISLYKSLSKSQTPIAYIQTDGKLGFQELWPQIYKREWAAKYKESDFYIDPERVTYVTQGYDLDKVGKALDKKNLQKYNKIIHYPIAETILANADKDLAYEMFPRTYDLGFGGATRDSHKVKKVKHYFTDENFNNYIFGGINLGEYHVHPKVSYQEVIPTMRNCKGTVIVGDKHYEDNYFTLRMYEGILANCLTYIDNDFDSQQKFYDGKFPELYISTPKQILHLDDTELKYEANNYILNRYNYKESQDKLIETLKQCMIN